MTLMDPLSISASVAGLTASCLQTAKTLHDLKDKFENANLTISAICTETTLISASMSHIQSHVLRNPESVSHKLQNQPSLESTLDQALTGCYVLFDVLQLEISTDSELLESSVDLRWKAKMRYIWNESTMKDILSQMRGLQTALTVLLQLLGVDTIAELRQIMDQNTAILSEVARHTSRISANKASRAPKSILDMSFKTRSFVDDGGSLYSSKLFAFDDEVVNSNVYRQVLAKAYARESATAKAEDLEDVTGFVEERDVPQNGQVQRTSEVSTPTSTPENREQTTSWSDDPLRDLLHEHEQPLRTWVEHWSLKPSDIITSVPNKEILRQEMLYELISTEKTFLNRCQLIRHLYYHRLTFDPVTKISRGSNWEFAAKNFGIHERFYHLHKTVLYEPLIARQSEGPWIGNVCDIFQRWLVEATELYLEYSARYPYLIAMIIEEASKNAGFAQFLTQSTDHPLSRKLSWTVYMRNPITRIQRYLLMLSTILKKSDQSDECHKYHDMEKLIEHIKDLTQRCDVEISKATNQVRVNSLRAETGPIGQRIISPTVVLFDEEFSHRKSGFRATTEVRVVVLSSPSSLVLVLNKASKPRRAGAISYEIVKQFTPNNSHPLYVSQTKDTDQQYLLRFSQGIHQSDLILSTTSFERAEELIRAIGHIVDFGTGAP